MRTIKFYIKFSTVSAIIFLIFTTTACLEQKAASSFEAAEMPEKVRNTTSPNSQIEAAQKIIEKAPESVTGYNLLGAAYIRSARETGDFGLNSRADAAVERALEIEPENILALKLKASLLLTFHRFAEALDAGLKLKQKYPQDAFIYGVLTDSNVELGNYEEAVESVQKMVDLKPNMESYARVSHVRSLYGDSKGAIEAMGLAVRMTHPAEKEALAWCRVRLGNEYFKAGRYKEAESAYDAALKDFPDYHFALTGKSQVRMAAGDYENAIKFLIQSQNRVPSSETIILLGDLYKRIGDSEKANDQYRLVEAVEEQLGTNNDKRGLALFWADHDINLDQALEIAAREHTNRKDVYTADIYAWCLYKKGRYQEAKVVIKEALRLKNQDARIFYHAGMIDKELGNKKQAKQFLQMALKTNPSFDLLQSENARAALSGL